MLEILASVPQCMIFQKYQAYSISQIKPEYFSELRSEIGCGSVLNVASCGDFLQEWRGDCQRL